MTYHLNPDGTVPPDAQFSVIPISSQHVLVRCWCQRLGLVAEYARDNRPKSIRSALRRFRHTLRRRQVPTC